GGARGPRDRPVRGGCGAGCPAGGGTVGTAPGGVADAAAAIRLLWERAGHGGGTGRGRSTGGRLLAARGGNGGDGTVGAADRPVSLPRARLLPRGADRKDLGHPLPAGAVARLPYRPSPGRARPSDTAVLDAGQRGDRDSDGKDVACGGLVAAERGPFPGAGGAGPVRRGILRGRAADADCGRPAAVSVVRLVQRRRRRPGHVPASLLVRSGTRSELGSARRRRAGRAGLRVCDGRGFPGLGSTVFAPGLRHGYNEGTSP